MFTFYEFGAQYLAPSNVTPTPTPTVTRTPNVTPTITPTNTLTPTTTPTNTVTPTNTQTITPTLTPSNTPSVTPPSTQTPTPSVTTTPTNTPTPTPTDPRECRTYTIIAEGSGTTFNWTNCDGTPDTLFLVGSPINICAKQGSVSLFPDGTIIDIGTCPLPTPTPTPTRTADVTSTPTPTNTTTPTPTASPAGGDADAAAYLAAVVATGGTVTSDITAAVETLFEDLKTAGIYSELLAFYPTLGSTSGSTALNGKRTNSQYDITWVNVGNMIFNVSGATGAGGGNNTAGITYILPSDLTTGNRHMSFYSSGDKGVDIYGYELGGGNGVTNVLITNYGNATGYFSFASYKTYLNSNGTGFYYTQVSGSTNPYNMVGYRNGVEVINTTTDDSGGSSYLSVLGDNRGVPPNITIDESGDKTMSWASYGNELTPTQITQFEEIINTFQTTLGRNTY